MKDSKKIARVSKLVGKLSARIAFYLVLIIMAGLLIFQIKPVQTAISKRVLEQLSIQTGRFVSLDQLRIAWLDRVNIDDFLILDEKNDTLVYAHRLTVNYRLRDILHQDFLKIEEISSPAMKLNLIKHDSASKMNISSFVDALRGDRKKKNGGKAIQIEEISITNLDFSIIDHSKEVITDRIDFSHFKMAFQDFMLADFGLSGDTIRTEIVLIRGEEVTTGFKIVDFRSSMMLSNRELSLTDLYFDTPQTHLSDSVKFSYSGLEDLGHFIDSVSMSVHLSDSRIAQKDLELIIGKVGLKSDLTFDGTIRGKVGDLIMEHSRIGFGSESFIAGGISCYGLPNASSTFALADITGSHIAPGDIEPYVGKLSENVAQLGRIDFTGSYAGFFNDFVASGDFVTEKGFIHSDINLKIPTDGSRVRYSGNLELRQVDIGAFLKTEEIQRLSLKGEIKGEGATVENARFNLKAVFSDVGVHGYVYDTLYTDGEFSNRFFAGNFEVKDPNCRIKGVADLDLRNEVEQLKVSLSVDSIQLEQLNFSSKEFHAKGKFSANISDLDINNFVGALEVRDAVARVGKGEIQVDSLLFKSDVIDSVRHLEVALPGVKAEMEGKFRITDAINDAKIMAAGYASKFRLSGDTVVRQRSGARYKIDAKVELGDINRYLEFLNVPLEIAQGTYIEASFRESRNANISFYLASDYIDYQGFKFYEPYLEVNGSKSLEEAGVLTNFIFESPKQSILNIPETNDLLLEGIWFNNAIDFTAAVRQSATSSNIRLETHTDLSPDSIAVKFMPSSIVLFDKKWSFNPANEIDFFANKLLKLNNFELQSAEELVGINGSFSGAEETSLEVRLHELDLGTAGEFASIDVQGILEADFNIFRKSVSEAFRFDGGFLAKGLTLNDFLLGDVNGISQWNSVERQIYTKIQVDRENFRSIDLDGFYYPLDQEQQLDFSLAIDQADLRIMEPFLQDRISDLTGFVDGRLSITGKATAPVLEGRCTISDGRGKLNYLNTTYDFDGAVRFLPKKLLFEDFQLLDRNESAATIRGGISHNGFSDFLLDIELQTSNFEFLNTTALDNSLYYGSAYGTGSINISGPPNDLLIKASVRTDNGTRFFIPVTEGGDISQQDYIAFIDFSDTLQLGGKERYQLKGITLDFDIEVTPDAYCELIFDIKTGDIIRGRGNGNLKLTLDTDGEFFMLGPLEIEEGFYNVTALGIVTKEFVVAKGSRITWFGDPYNAVLDIDAYYQQRASFELLKNQNDQDQTKLNNKSIVNVVLDLTGNMLAPEIDFDLQLADQVDLVADRDDEATLARIRVDDQELRRQVISLLFFKRFSPPESFIAGGGDIGSSASEFLSRQVSYLMSQLDENLEVEVDLASLDENAFNTFQLRLAYTFLNGRLTVTRGGGFTSNQEAKNQAWKDIVGDWSIEYSLTNDGRLRAKVFSNTANQRIVASQAQQSQDVGVSLRFVHSFNALKEIIARSRQEAIQKRKETQEKKGGDQAIGANTIYR